MSSNIRPCIKEFTSGDFISVQACPYKVEFTEEKLAAELDRIAGSQNKKVILLPIGYASGHDDVVFLRKVKSMSKNDFLLLDDLNVWEIMYVISKSKAFFGTSLHGVITAMSFGVAHFSLNGNIDKLTSFLNTWSVYPFNIPLENADIAKAIDNVEGEHIASLKLSVKNAQSIIFKSLNDVTSIL